MDGVDRTWRPSAWMRASAIVGSLFFIVMTGVVLWFVSSGSTDGSRLDLGVVVLPIGAVFCVRYAIRSRIALSPEAVTVDNAFKSYAVPLSEITHARGGYNGLEISRAGRRKVVAGAVQKSNWATWTGRETRSDEIAHAILDAKRRRAERIAEAVDAGNE